MSVMVYRYTVPIDGGVHEFDLGGHPLAVAVDQTEQAVEFWAQFSEHTPTVRRRFIVIGTGHPIPAINSVLAKHRGTTARTLAGLVWHLYEMPS